MALRSLGDVNGAMSQGTTFLGKFVPQYLSFHKLLYEKITTQTKQQNRNNVSAYFREVRGNSLRNVTQLFTR